MSTFQKVLLEGFVGQEPTIHNFDNGGKLAKFSVATTESWTSKQSGERVSKTEWHNVLVSNKGAEVIEKYLEKGDKIFIEGKLETRKWTDTNGVERYSTEIKCDNFKLMTTKAEKEQRNSHQPESLTRPQQNQKPNPENAGNEFLAMENNNDDDHDDLPF